MSDIKEYSTSELYLDVTAAVRKYIAASEVHTGLDADACLKIFMHVVNNTVLDMKYEISARDKRREKGEQ